MSKKIEVQNFTVPRYNLLNSAIVINILLGVLMEEKIKRRNFITGMLSGASVMLGGLILYPIMKYIFPPPQTEVIQNTVTVGKVDKFPNFSGTIFRFGNVPGILIRTQEGEFRAFSAVCKHLNCTVQFNKEHGDIWCPCHNGHYDLNGNNISGPPPRPLDKFDVLVKDGDIIVSRKV